MRDLATEADRLRALHGGPLVLANVWDAASARVVEDAGFPAVATSSAAVAAARGAADDDSLDPDVAFAAIFQVAHAVTVPVTADIEAGYGLPADTLASRLLEAGAVGCNLEDADHHGSSVLVPPEAHAGRISAVKAAGRARGVDVVVNARIDTYIRAIGTPAEQLAETLRRGRLYRDAGADCVYPIGLVDLTHIRSLVEELGVVNVWLRPGSPSLAALISVGVARISLGSGLHKLITAALRETVRGLRNGEVPWPPQRSSSVSDSAAQAGIHALDHVQLAMPPGQEPAAVEFYQNVLRLTAVAKPAHLAARGGCWFESLDAHIHLGVDVEFHPARKAHPALLVRDLPALIQRLEAAGHTVRREEPLAGYDRVYVDDPFGNRIELMEPTR